MRLHFLFLFTVLGWLSPLRAADANWLSDLPKAQAKAKAENRLVLMNFTGSDFCSACIRLHKEVFPTKEFTDYAQRRLVLMEVDFPMKKKLPEAVQAANEALEKQFKVSGYPTLLVLAEDGKLLGEVEFDLFDAKAKDIIAGIEKIAAKAKAKP